MEAFSFWKSESPGKAGGLPIFCYSINLYRSEIFRSDLMQTGRDIHSRIKTVISRSNQRCAIFIKNLRAFVFAFRFFGSNFSSDGNSTEKRSSFAGRPYAFVQGSGSEGLSRQAQAMLFHNAIALIFFSFFLFKTSLQSL